ncbi:hypothetical protein D3C87_850570 [compost metagenome]
MLMDYKYDGLNITKKGNSVGECVWPFDSDTIDSPNRRIIISTEAQQNGEILNRFSFAEHCVVVATLHSARNDDSEGAALILIL